MYYLRKLWDRSQAWLERRFPQSAHARHLAKWDRHWNDPDYNPFWKTDQPQRELVEAVATGWFARDGRVIDLGCGNGEVTRWLAEQGFEVLGVDYSSAAIMNCRRLSADSSGAPAFEVADLCNKDCKLPVASSLIDRGCFHRLADNCQRVFAQNVARATLQGGHLLLLAGTFQRADFAHYRGAKSQEELRQHVERIFGNYFAMERAEPAVINASGGQEGMPAVAFWMVRRDGGEP